VKHFAKKKRGFNEIYFVLYLTAIVLLIPKKDADDKINLGDEFNRNQNSQVFIKSEKSSLNLRLRANTEGIEIISLDTSNIIYPVGNVYSVDYHFSLVSGSQKIRIGEFDSNSMFVIEKIENSNNARFTWLPNKKQLSTKNYSIIAEADIYLDSAKKVKTYSRTEFALNIYFLDEQPPSFTRTLIPQENDEKINPQIINQIINNSNLLDIYPENNSIKSLAYSPWQNKINLIGIKNLSEINQNIQIKSNSEDSQVMESVKISERTSKYLVVEGTTPGYGKLDIEIVIKSKDNLNQVSTAFSVLPIAIGNPVLERVMYPEKSYLIDPKLPISSSKKMFSRIIHGSRILYETNNSAKFRFSPTMSDTGSTLYFERIIGTETLPQRIPIQVKNYPNPEIISIREKGSDILITTKSYGVHESAKNLVVEIISDKKFKFRDLTGQTQKIEGGRLQVFAIKKSKLSNISEINFSAVDSRGFKSKSTIFRK
jgi:hypothetical protein